MNNKLSVLVGSFLLILALLFGIGTALLIFTSDGKTDDSGVVVCEQMASSSGGADLDKEWRQKRLAEFGQSKHEDLRMAGTNFVEAAFKMNEELEDADLEKLNELNSNLVTKHAVLRNACSNHGVNIPALNA